MTKKNIDSSEPIVKKPRKKRGTYKKKSKAVSISANTPKKAKQENKTITDDAIITNLTQHFSNIISGGMAEKRRLVKAKDFKNKKNKKIKYVVQNDGSIKIGKKADSGKNTVTVHYN